ncbi:adenylyl-sulfate kinase [Undibacterium sp. SXout11W]|uniref:adenylyl-sulfate kinase n=1 Tax=Undibacterium sp. SXout11W TaxID=3413050 RepID=UPI003BF37489
MHTPKTIWFTGLPGSGKSTLARATARKLTELDIASTILDGDIVRQGLCKDLGFSAEDRHENLRRIAEVAALMNQAGLTVLVATISPLQKDRDMACAIVGRENWIDVFVATSVEVCERRDPKGMYARARRGEIVDFTGVSSPYEAPLEPSLIIDTDLMSVEDAVDPILSVLALRFMAPQNVATLTQF